MYCSVLPGRVGWEVVDGGASGAAHAWFASGRNPDDANAKVAMSVDIPNFITEYCQRKATPRPKYDASDLPSDSYRYGDTARSAIPLGRLIDVTVTGGYRHHNDLLGLLKKNRVTVPLEQALRGLHLHYYHHLRCRGCYWRDGAQHRHGCDDRV